MPLVIVPTPIGNLEDMTLRGLRALKGADLIACEDTRRTLKLLNHFNIKKPLISCHEHNEARRAEELMRHIEAGKTVALVSDAGTPGLSDPGMTVIKAAIERGLPYDVLPGANALLPALLMSGIGTGSFLFVGFLKGSNAEKRNRLINIKNIEDAIVFYIAPHHLTKDLEIIAEVLGDRKAALVREISKVHQETIRGTLKEFGCGLPEEKIRGEFVCVVDGAAKMAEEEDDLKWMQEADEMCGSNEPMKKVANLLAIKYCIPRNRIKKYMLEKYTREGK